MRSRPAMCLTEGRCSRTHGQQALPVLQQVVDHLRCLGCVGDQSCSAAGDGVGAGLGKVEVVRAK